MLGASHTTEMATRFSRRIRGMVQSHGATLGIALNDDTQAADHWALSNDGQNTAAGVGTAIVGVRVDALLIDDPSAHATTPSPQPSEKTCGSGFMRALERGFGLELHRF